MRKIVKGGFLPDDPYVLMELAPPTVPLMIGFAANECAFMIPTLQNRLKKGTETLESMITVPGNSAQVFLILTLR